MIVATDNLSKEYDGVYRVQELDIRIKEGDIYGFLGPNGAGKSTLMKVLSGAYRPSAGRVSFAGGATYDYLTPALSRRLGINIVYQENDLVPSMNVVENIFVGSEKTNKFGLIQYEKMKEYNARWAEKGDSGQVRE